MDGLSGLSSTILTLHNQLGTSFYRYMKRTQVALHKLSLLNLFVMTGDFWQKNCSLHTEPQRSDEIYIYFLYACKPEFKIFYPS